MKADVPCLEKCWFAINCLQQFVHFVIAPPDNSSDFSQEELPSRPAFVPTLNLSNVPKNLPENGGDSQFEKHKPIVEDVPPRVVTQQPQQQPQPPAQRVMNRTVSTSVLPRAFPIQGSQLLPTHPTGSCISLEK